jgi:uncharacterized protein
MNNLTAPLVLNVGFISQQSIGYNRVFYFDLPELVLQPDLKLRQVEGEIEFSRTSEGLLAQGKFQAVVDATCGRCLCDFEQVLITDFTELFTFPSHVREDTELVYPEDGQIDFGPILREYMILEIPINPVCKQDCKGLCSVCGNNLNTEPCDHELDSIDPRMSVLKSLLDD